MYQLNQEFLQSGDLTPNTVVTPTGTYQKKPRMNMEEDLNRVRFTFPYDAVVPYLPNTPVTIELTFELDVKYSHGESEIEVKLEYFINPNYSWFGDLITVGTSTVIEVKVHNEINAQLYQRIQELEMGFLNFLLFYLYRLQGAPYDYNILTIDVQEDKIRTVLCP